MTKCLFIFLSLTLSFPAEAQSWTHLEPGRIRIGGEIGDRIDRTIDNNLMVLDAEKDFLQPFRDKNQTSGFIGLGMLIDSAVRLAAYSQEEKVIARKNNLIVEALKAQEPDGYLGILKPEARVWALWDIHEMSYLIAGLVSDYRLFGERRSLEAAQRIADFIIERWEAEPEGEPGGGEITVYMAVTGSETAMMDLYEITGEKRYLEYCTEQRDLDQWDGPIVIGRWGPIQGHAYAYMSRCLAQLQLNRVAPNPNLLKPTRKVLDFLLREEGLVISGGCGDHECWHNTQEGTTNLGETCATAYLMRFLDRLFCEEGDSRYLDLIDRALWNALFAAQSPDGRRIRYYTPFEVSRQYFEGDTYCCPCNYRRIVSELPDLVYYRTDGGFLVSLYTPSEAEIDLGEKGTVNVEQKTAYPANGEVELIVTPSAPRPLRVSLRIPGWCGNAQVRINGEVWSGSKPEAGKILSIEREWKPGDRVQLSMPMNARWVVGRVAQSGRVALMQGPRVFGVNRERNALPKDLDLRLITLDPKSLEGPFPDETLRPGGISYKVQAWAPGEWYPMAKKGLALTLTEFPDPGIEMVYFKVPKPDAEGFVGDELVKGGN